LGSGDPHQSEECVVVHAIRADPDARAGCTCGPRLTPLLKAGSHLGELVFGLLRGYRLHGCLQVRGVLGDTVG